MKCSSSLCPMAWKQGEIDYNSGAKYNIVECWFSVNASFLLNIFAHKD